MQRTYLGSFREIVEVSKRHKLFNSRSLRTPKARTEPPTGNYINEIHPTVCMNDVYGTSYVVGDTQLITTERVLMAVSGNRNGTRPTRTTKARPGDPGVDWVHPLLGKWAAWQRAAHLSRETIRIQGPTVNNFAKEISVDPVSACHDDVIEWFDRHNEWTVATAAAYYSALQAWFKWLVKMGHRDDNPMILVPTPRRPPGTPRPVSDEDVRRLLTMQLHKRTRTMVILAALAGLRVSEIAKIKGEDFDLSAGLVYIRGKGGAVKTVPLHPMVVTAATQMPTSGYWFPGRDGFGGKKDKNRPVKSGAVTATIGRTMERAGIRGTPHALRHWFATASLRASGDLRAVQGLMRHASVTSTQIYTELADDRRAEVVNMLDPFAAPRQRFIESKRRRGLGEIEDRP